MKKRKFIFRGLIVGVSAFLLLVLVSGVIINAFDGFGGFFLAGDKKPGETVSEEFGGTVVMNATFDMLEDTSDVIALQFGSTLSSVRFPGYLDIEQSHFAETSHMNLYATRMGSLSLSEVDYFAIDLDIAIEAIAGEMQIQPRFYSNGSLAGAVTGNSASYNISTSNKTSFEIFKTEKNVNYKVREISNNKFYHITLLYDLTADSPSQYKQHLYIDGQYIDTHTGFLKSSADHSKLTLSRLRISSDAEGYAFYMLDNYTITTFETGYTGAISDVANDSSLSLQDCVDSVLYKKIKSNRPGRTVTCMAIELFKYRCNNIQNPNSNSKKESASFL